MREKLYKSIISIFWSAVSERLSVTEERQIGTFIRNKNMQIVSS